MEKIMVRVTGDAETLEVIRDAFVEALEEFGLDVIEKSLPREYGGYWAVFLTALKMENPPVAGATSPNPPGLRPPPFDKGGERGGQ